MTDRDTIAQRKKEVHATKSVHRTENANRRRANHRVWRKCFWTWPWGHAYMWSNSAQARLCVGCDRREPMRGEPG